MCYCSVVNSYIFCHIPPLGVCDKLVTPAFITGQIETSHISVRWTGYFILVCALFDISLQLILYGYKFHVKHC